MGFIGFIVLGLIVGAITKSVLPGRVNGGWATSLILGVVGAMVGGWLGSIFFNVHLGTFFDVRTWLLALVGGLVVAGAYGMITGRSSHNHH